MFFKMRLKKKKNPMRLKTSLGPVSRLIGLFLIKVTYNIYIYTRGTKYFLYKTLCIRHYNVMCLEGTIIIIIYKEEKYNRLDVYEHDYIGIYNTYIYCIPTINYIRVDRAAAARTGRRVHARSRYNNVLFYITSLREVTIVEGMSASTCGVSCIDFVNFLTAQNVSTGVTTSQTTRDNNLLY